MTHPADAVVPTHEVFELRHTLTLGASVYSEDELQKFKHELLALIKENNMSYVYDEVVRRFNWSPDLELKTRMDVTNAEILKKLEEEWREAEKQYGDVEIKDCMLATAHHFARIGDWNTAQLKYEEVIGSKAMESTAKVNVYLTLCRISLFHKDTHGAIKWLAKAEKQFELGGDWETRNRMRVYQALHLAQNERKFAKAAELLISSLATFTATELISFSHFVTLTVLLSAMSLERPILKSQVMKSPEVLQVLAGNDVLNSFFTSFVDCNYNVFFKAFKEATDIVKRDLFITGHYRYYVRNMRLVAYRQYLRPYKSVTIPTMATAFGVSEEFIEDEVVSFIPSGMLSTKVDRIDRALITDADDAAVVQHSEFVRASDDLTNQLQMLSRVIDM